MDKPDTYNGVPTIGPNESAYLTSTALQPAQCEVDDSGVPETDPIGMSSNGTQQITTALLLAAGTGSRLQPLTDDAPIR